MLAASELKAKGHQQRGLLKLSNKSFFLSKGRRKGRQKVGSIIS